MTHSAAIALASAGTPGAGSRGRCAGRWRISPQAGRALEILGHAIGYLADEYVHAGVSFAADDSQVQAIQLLMKLNREIYLDCPVVPTLAERWRALLHFRTL